MKSFEFQLLSEKEKADLLYREGVYIGKRKEGPLTVLLYQADSFYVEVFYHKYRRFIVRMRCSESTSILDPYLEQIEIGILVG